MEKTGKALPPCLDLANRTRRWDSDIVAKWVEENSQKTTQGEG